ncbi:YifB family Mg chelatase-like AAA ATPase [Campylobacter fetus]|uniref:YifB family Mg chelatase-like AAA ATPase n=1 Tax=Campylobacter fetus TaxID=196 RepID=UPI0003C2AF09|nr:YifB family Mg chelatase-like AAA ATPase [Campylobacter fetus]AGZ82478.1 Mg chelatase-related protein [Campylobacter fetus subsp. testudinum 03-427]AJB46197.1 Fis family transcriptional regulator [Campylobacter fetus subsp. testudinum]EAI4322573.1 ATP-binding protein [Campylobacter fetus]EAI4391306.1 ATP-binding protein [Campylobacter fetus]OCS06151.1 Fis family transcriptional regulator [Campylobacter fetus subsp. testudinum]
MKSLKSACLSSKLHIIDIESTFLRALPGFDIVGLASTTIKESVTRVRSALGVIKDFNLPAMKIVINLSPSDVKKDGSHFDLPIALLILLQKERFDSDFFVFGELSLDGSLKSSAELFSILLFLSVNIKSANVLLPKDIALKAAMIPNLTVFAVSNLNEARDFFLNEEFKQSCKVVSSHPLFENVIEINDRKFVPNFNYELDFKDIKGQERAKRACIISASGMHNILFEGSPGCGKSMSAKRLAYILPPQSLNEILLASAYQSLNSNNCDFSSLRAFRSPHHTSTRSSIFGGGSGMAKIGEVALANGGVLFFDEFPHFGKQILESLREPLEDNKINISRVNSKTSYETKFLFVAAMNPCPCGNAFSKFNSCRCSDKDITRYQSMISKALLDRIDIYVSMGEISSEDRPSLSSKDMYSMVLDAFKRQTLRGQSELNGKLKDAEITKFCVCDKDAKITLNKAIVNYHLSQRGINKTLKVARTIADLDGEENINKVHILESLSYRMKI